MKKIAFFVLLCAFAWTSSAFAGDDAVLATVGSTKITMADFDRIIGYYDAEKQKILDKNPVYKATILQRMVQGMVLSKIARDKGFADRPDVKEQIELMTNDLLAAEYLKKEVVDKIKVTDEDMQLYYKSHQDEFKVPEMIRARHILIKVVSDAPAEYKEKAKEKAEEILKRIKAGEDFARLATDFSEDGRTKAYGGDLGFIPRGRMPAEFDKVAFALPEGGVIDVVETQAGYDIIKLEDRRAAAVESFDSVKDKVKEKVFADFRKGEVDSFVKEAMAKAGAKMNLDVFLPKK
jgi:peptidyl-prolyl cis-trans isomerase C